MIINLLVKKKEIENKINDDVLEKLDFYKIYNNTFGIIDTGLTCYINSVIQILIHANTFIEKFIGKVQIIEKNHNSTSNFFIKCYRKFIKTIIQMLLILVNLLISLRIYILYLVV